MENTPVDEADDDIALGDDDIAHPVGNDDGN